MLSQAIELAARAHEGQVDKQGEPYILHPLRVMLAVASHGEDAMAVAVLHDVLEDTDYGVADLIAADMPERVIVAVQAVSKIPSEDYMDFIARAANNHLGRIVKKADIRDNLREPFPFGESMRRRYERALKFLWETRPATGASSSSA